MRSMEGDSPDKILVESPFNQALESAVGHMREGYQILDRDFRYLYVNPAAARHGKTTVEALLGRRMADVYPGIEFTELYASLRDAMFDGRVHFMTNPFTFPDGTLGHFELRIQPVPEGIVVFSIDVTEREKCNRRGLPSRRNSPRGARFTAVACFYPAKSRRPPMH